MIASDGLGWGCCKGASPFSQLSWMCTHVPPVRQLRKYVYTVCQAGKFPGKPRHRTRSTRQGENCPLGLPTYRLHQDDRLFWVLQSCDWEIHIEHASGCCGKLYSCRSQGGVSLYYSQLTLSELFYYLTDFSNILLEMPNCNPKISNVGRCRR